MCRFCSAHDHHLYKVLDTGLLDHVLQCLEVFNLLTQLIPDRYLKWRCYNVPYSPCYASSECLQFDQSTAPRVVFYPLSNHMLETRIEPWRGRQRRFFRGACLASRKASGILGGSRYFIFSTSAYRQIHRRIRFVPLVPRRTNCLPFFMDCMSFGSKYTNSYRFPGSYAALKNLTLVNLLKFLQTPCEYLDQYHILMTSRDEAYFKAQAEVYYLQSYN
jgi:hypothetical protein